MSQRPLAVSWAWTPPQRRWQEEDSTVAEPERGMMDHMPREKRLWMARVSRPSLAHGGSRGPAVAAEHSQGLGLRTRPGLQRFCLRGHFALPSSKLINLLRNCVWPLCYKNEYTSGWIHYYMFTIITFIFPFDFTR